MAITLGSVLPVGTIIHSMLSTTQFASEYGSNWVLADGRSVSGSLYHQVTGIAAIPDMRGLFLRGKGSTFNPDGDLALGTFTDDKFESHNHTGPLSADSGSQTFNYYPNVTSDATPALATASSPANFIPSAILQGGNETAPKSITVNIFIRIN